jgi:hypothetical protein
MAKVKSPAAAALKYKELLLQSSQEKELQEVEFRVEEMQQSLEADILATKRSLASEKASLVRYKSQFPLNAQNLVNVQVKIESLEDGLARLIALKEELF